MKGISGFVFPRMRVVAMAVAVGCAMGASASSVCAAEPSAAIQGLIDKASTQGSVRVIVMLAVDNQLESFLSATQVEDQRKQLSQTQDKVIAVLESAPSRAVSSLQDLTRFEVTPGFAANITADDIQLLRANPLVADIVEDVAVPPTLTQSIPLIGGSSTTGFSGYKGAGWAVAVLDTGVQKTHPFMDSKVISEACYSSTTSQSTSVCPGGASSSTASGSGVNCTGASGCDHGTHVAGIVAGRSSTMSGVARDARIIAVQVFSKFSSTTDCGSNAPCVLTWNSDQIKGLERVYALRSTHNIAAVNMSLGGGNYTSNCDSDSRKPIIDQLKAAGIATVIASGNNGYTNAVGAPSCISTAVTVGSTTKSDVVASYSNSATLVDLLAPGSSIYSSIPTNSYASFNGTSMATPHVAGAFAVLKSVKPTATVDQIESALKSTGTSVLDARNNISKPRIQVAAALAALVPPIIKAKRYDYNKDSISDILFREASSGSLGAYIVSTTSTSWSPIGGSSPAWGVVWQGDFNGDKYTDILFREPASGSLGVYLMNGTSPSWSNIGAASPTYIIQGIGDFNGDSNSDILFRNLSSGDIGIYFMNGSSFTWGHVGGSSPSWSIAGVGDFNGDGKSDILFRNGSSGEIGAYFMNGSSFTWAYVGGASSSYSIVGIGDFNNDSKSDILFRSGTGDLGVYFMNGVAFTWASVGGSSTAYSVVQVGDYNGDGKDDILFRNLTTGDLGTYLMNGSSFTWRNIGASSPSWHVKQ